MALGAIQLVGIGSAIVFLLLLLGLHGLRNELEPRGHPISDYGRGPHAWIFAASLVALAIAKFAAAASLAPKTVTEHAAVVLLVIDGLATLVVALAPTDLGAETTTIGAVHRLAAGFAFIGGTLAFLLASASLYLRHAPLALPLLCVAALTVLLLLAFGASLWADRYVGLAERALIASIVSWLVLSLVAR